MAGAAGRRAARRVWCGIYVKQHGLLSVILTTCLYRPRIKVGDVFYVVAEKWLKRNYIVNGREREGEKRGEGEEGKVKGKVREEEARRE